MRQTIAGIQLRKETRMSGPTPEKVMQLITGAWAASILGTAAGHGLFTALEDNPDTAAGLAKRVGISPRGAQALLDGLTGLGLLTLRGGEYHNTPDASAFLVMGKPSYLGAMAEVFLNDFGTWQRLPESAKTGLPTAVSTTDVADNPFWHVLVTAIAPLSFPVARMMAERLGLATAGRVSWLDIGGGSGVWSAAWLGANNQAIGYQLDWPNVNAIAREFVAKFGVADRFKTIDGDFHTTDFGAATYDFAIYSHVAHQESPSDNIAIFRRLRKALKPGGTLVVNDFVLNDDRTGHPFAMLFASQMLVATKEGFTYRQSDYRTWLSEAGFASVEIVPTPTPATVVLAK
jgi:ubiquinone/menaquinone biosynthesis C-methylase UbiE